MAPRQADQHPQSPEHTVFGHALRETRARRALSQEKLGEVSGMHRNYVGALERGEINATLKILFRLARGLRLPLSELFELYERRGPDYGLPPSKVRTP